MRKSLFVRNLIILLNIQSDMLLEVAGVLLDLKNRCADIGSIRFRLKLKFLRSESKIGQNSLRRKIPGPDLSGLRGLQ